MNILDKFKLDGFVALVTGAATGLGAEIAIALAQAGAQVACHGNTRSPKETVDTIEEFGGVAHSLTGDLSHQQTPKLLVEETLNRFAHLDILVNNAGTIRRSPAVDYSEEDWAAVIEVNLSSVFRLSQLAGKRMIDSGRGGKIVNIASLLSFQGGITVPAYAASKGGVAQLTKALANEWAKHRINVNAIAPGYMRTTNTAALQADETRNRQILERIPAGRWGEASDVSGAAVFLSSPASDYINGHILLVDGGWMGR
jgi:2-deoxy-D-gluconate 3-dehydrogenase